MSDEQGMYRIYDVKAEAYQTPWFARNDATARRMFQDACADESSQLYTHPEDFILYFVGIVYDETPEPVVHTARCIAKATEFNQPNVAIVKEIAGGTN